MVLHGLRTLNEPYPLAAPAAGSPPPRGITTRHAEAETDRRVPARSAARPDPDRLLVHLVRRLRHPSLEKHARVKKRSWKEAVAAFAERPTSRSPADALPHDGRPYRPKQRLAVAGHRPANR